MAEPPHKRARHDSDDEDSIAATTSTLQGQEGASTKPNKSRTRAYEITDAPIPNAERYERSFMHQSHVVAVCAADRLPQGAAQGFLLSMGRAGDLKFWRKVSPTLFGGSSLSENGEDAVSLDSDQRRNLGQQLVFAKHFQAHDLRKCGFVYVASSQALDGGTRAVTAGGDGNMCVFDVANFDMSGQFALDRVCIAPIEIVGRTGAWVALAGLPRQTMGLPVLSDGDADTTASSVAVKVSPGAIALFDPTGARDPLAALSSRSVASAPIASTGGSSTTALAPVRINETEELSCGPENGPVSSSAGPAVGTTSRHQRSLRPFRTLQLHSTPVICLAYNAALDVCVSAEAGGALACFSVSEAADAIDPDESCFPSKIFIREAALSGENDQSGNLSELDFSSMFYCFVKARTFCVAMAFSPDGTTFVALGHDRKVRVFDFLRGKLLKEYDETLEFYQRHQKRLSDSRVEKDNLRALEPMEFGRRISIEKELDKRWLAWREWLNGGCRNDVPIPPQPPSVTIRFDARGRFLAYGCLLGIKVIDIERSKVFGILGRKDAQLRFNDFAFYQPVSVPGTETNVEAFTTNETTPQDELRLRMGGPSGAVGSNAVKVHHDPTLICTAFKKNRFYLITTREPLPQAPGRKDVTPLFLTTLEDRDVFNEAPPPEEASTIRSQKQSRLAHTAVIHTTLGDIRLKLFWEDAPKAVENFTQLARRGYYNNLIFHRVIVNFMIQTGDPTGTGMGGESAFPGGKPFDDEIRLPKLKHERYTLSMANAGPNTNGSQFFVTAVPCPSLDGKHTVFGRVTAGQDVVHRIERVKVDAEDKPLDDIRMLSVSTTLVGAKEV